MGSLEEKKKTSYLVLYVIISSWTRAIVRYNDDVDVDCEEWFEDGREALTVDEARASISKASGANNSCQELSILGILG